ncbi:hypothetical protein [Hymenobacter convexus]|uniref:hypothetical protein n=1 Tax=Hymenobacter sp. CA1UV-4 TaxID=3063782 RepID=UPI002713BCBB|nr:hypothetical protein [Hymenobacter sp. CA1UV-4]MDO7851565.1 hypothetical protein [Hymenobacter sp. CA1UV-4]
MAHPRMWRPVQRRLDQLTPLENNPFGKITAEKRRRLEQKLLELGTFEAATVDNEGVLLTFNKRHNLLLGLYGPSYEVTVLEPTGELTDTQRRKIILASNVNEGEWIDDILRQDYDDVMADVGVQLSALDAEAEAATGAGKEAEAEFPIVAEFSEKYDAVVIVCRNDIDANFVREVLGLAKEQSYKSKEVGQTRVIDAKVFCEKWKSR